MTAFATGVSQREQIMRPSCHERSNQQARHAILTANEMVDQHLKGMGATKALHQGFHKREPTPKANAKRAPLA